MTEDEAKNKWCPMVRAREYGSGEENAVAYNRDYLGNFGSAHRCIGSECMMWVRTETRTEAKPTGYCGLAREW